MKKMHLFMIMLVISLALGVATVSAANTTAFIPASVTLNATETQAIALVIDEVPTGLSGFNVTVSLADPSVAEIVSVDAPAGWGIFELKTTLPADVAVMSAVDITDVVNPGDTNVTLATFTVRGDSTGTSAIDLTVNGMDDDTDPAPFIITPTVTPGEVTVTGPPTADFSATPLSGEAPLTVQFTDASTGSPTAWNWSFGDGEFSADQSPEHIYANPGTYTVNLTATNAYGADSEEKADYITVTEVPVGDPDLVVTLVNPNGGYLFANEANSIDATILNNGTAAAGAFNVTFTTTGGFTESVAVASLAAGAETTLTVVDPTIRAFDDAVTITVTADPSDAVNESDELNNEATLSLNVVYNGYKGMRYTDGDDIGTFRDLELRGDLVYSFGDSYYLSASSVPDWTTYSVNWTAAELAIPANATVQLAWLYVPYTWDKGPVFPAQVSLAFDGSVRPTVGFYSDEKYWGTSYPYGMTVYEATGIFDPAADHTAVLTNTAPGGGNVSVRGMVLLVVYGDDTATEKKIFINEGFDMLYGGEAQYTTPEEATAYAPFDAVTTGNPVNMSAYISSANLITLAPGAGPAEGDLIFNNQTWTNVWSYAGATQIGVDERDVQSYLLETGNEAAFQSSADYMEAALAFLVVEYADPIPPVAAFEADVTSGDVPLAVQFTDLSTGATSWLWDFGDNATSTQENPAHTYTEPGLYTVSLTVENIFGNDTATEADYINATVGAPVANFSADPVSGTAPLAVQFTDESVGYNITAWLWDFGVVNATSTEQNPLYTYLEEGVYTVSLTVTNAVGNATETKTDYINVTAVGPTPTPTVEPVLTPSGGGGASSFSFDDGTGTILTSSEGKVLSDTRITAEDGIATFSIDQGVTALNSDGTPIDEVTVTPLDTVPETPEGATFAFAGYAWECTPSGAEFSPSATLTFTFTEEEWAALEGEDLTVRFYNAETGEWEEVSATVDPETMTITVEVTHFTIFAVFLEGAAGPTEAPTAAPTGTGTPVTTAATTAPATTVPQTEPTQSPGFGLLAGLAGLGAVAVLALRRR